MWQPDFLAAGMKWSQQILRRSDDSDLDHIPAGLHPVGDIEFIASFGTQRLRPSDHPHLTAIQLDCGEAAGPLRKAQDTFGSAEHFPRIAAPMLRRNRAMGGSASTPTESDPDLRRSVLMQPLIGLEMKL